MARKDPTQTDPAMKPETDATGAERSSEIDQHKEEAGNELDLLREQLEEANDRSLRRQADLENYRKRAAREIADYHRYANLPLMRDLLPVLDNIGRAIEAAEKAHETASLLEGFKMVAGQLKDVLGRYYCAEIQALNEPFDPNLHEAISQQPSEQYAANTVLTVVQSGFRLHDRVVRPSQVIVSSPALKEEKHTRTATD